MEDIKKEPKEPDKNNLDIEPINEQKEEKIDKEENHKKNSDIVSKDEEVQHNDLEGEEISRSNLIETTEVKKVRIVAVKRRSEWAPLHYDAGDIEVSDGEWVVFPTDHGIEVGRIAGRVVPLLFPADIDVPKIERLASTQEIEQYYRNLEKEKDAWKICDEFIKELGLSMKLVVVERFFDGSKVIFYYVAEQRVDFRELVKKLVRALRTRIEMRQIGVRHEAKMLGGIGCCGRELCCSTFLKSFDPISIKMAKAQNLPLNPSKISGICGRLLCCLTYEYDTYLDLKQGLPSLGKSCDTPAGEGKVINQNIILGTVTVAFSDGARREFSLKELEQYLESKGADKEKELDESQDSAVIKEEDQFDQEHEDIISNKELLDRLSRHEDFSDNISYIELEYEGSDDLHFIEEDGQDSNGVADSEFDEKEYKEKDEREQQLLEQIQDESEEEKEVIEDNTYSEELKNKDSSIKTKVRSHSKRKKTRRYNEEHSRGGYRTSRSQRQYDKRGGQRASRRLRSTKKERPKRR